MDRWVKAAVVTGEPRQLMLRVLGDLVQMGADWPCLVEFWETLRVLHLKWAWLESYPWGPAFMENL